MKIRVVLLSVAVAFVITGCASKDAVKPGSEAAQTLGPAAKKWNEVEQPKEFLEFFEGTFKKLAVTVEETGETFTVEHTGERFVFSNGRDDDAEYVVPVRMENIDRMVKRASDDKLDAEDAYAIVNLMFTPMTASFFKGDVIEDENLRKISDVEDHLHVTLIDAEGNDGSSHTVQFADGKWNIEAGLNGTPKRALRLTAEQAVDYMRHASEARRRNNPAGWLKFVNWYQGWRDGVTVAAGEAEAPAEGEPAAEAEAEAPAEG
jgi:hypothetical protein